MTSPAHVNAVIRGEAGLHPPVDIIYKNQNAKLTFQRGDEEVDLVALGVRPALDDGRPELDVGLVHLRRLAHVDLVWV